jgi:hypothetical protein
MVRSPGGVNLFNGYREVKDKRFRTWVQNIKDAWLDRTIVLDPNGLQLMERTENYFKDRTRKNLWLRLDEDQETIIALKAQLTKKTGGGTTKKKKNEHWKKEEPRWKFQPPRKGESGTKITTVNGERIPYFWCPHHEKWTIHKPQDCRKKADKKPTGDTKKPKSPKTPKSSTTTPKETNDKPDPALKVMTAAIQEVDATDGDFYFSHPDS